MVGLVGLPPGGARQSSGDDYPQWRGIHRDGSASAFLVPAQWPNTLTMQWKAEIGAGYATPILVGDTAALAGGVKHDTRTLRRP